jgi:hypothetical protein
MWASIICLLAELDQMSQSIGSSITGRDGAINSCAGINTAVILGEDGDYPQTDAPRTNLELLSPISPLTRQTYSVTGVIV